MSIYGIIHSSKQHESYHVADTILSIWIIEKKDSVITLKVLTV